MQEGLLLPRLVARRLACRPDNLNAVVRERIPIRELFAFSAGAGRTTRRSPRLAVEDRLALTGGAGRITTTKGMTAISCWKVGRQTGSWMESVCRAASLVGGSVVKPEHSGKSDPLHSGKSDPLWRRFDGGQSRCVRTLVCPLVGSYCGTPMELAAANLEYRVAAASHGCPQKEVLKQVTRFLQAFREVRRAGEERQYKMRASRRYALRARFRLTGGLDEPSPFFSR